MTKVFFSTIFIFSSLMLFAEEGSVMLHCKSKGAVVYVDGKRTVVVEKEVTPLTLEEGDHLIKVVKPFSHQCDKYGERELYVSAGGSVNLMLEPVKKLEPTEAFKKVREKKDLLKAERFIRTESMLVKDNQLEIMWQDNEVTKTRRDLEASKVYCKKLELSKFDDWRLPSYEELVSIVDYDRFNVAIMPSFKNNFASIYWSSTKDVSSVDYLWSVDFYRGKTQSSALNKKYHTRCVRNLSKVSPSHLIWDDSRESKVLKKDWKHAKGYCQDMILGNKDDWRLPSIKELQSIVSVKQYKPAIKHGFKYVAEDYYWSSSEDISTDGYAWSVAFNYGTTTRDSILNEYGVRCVRDE